jgi:predicted GNAT family acetyltransferase
MSSNLDAMEIRDNPAQHRYEAHLDGHLAVITYRREEGQITFIHTVVSPALEGRGVASKLVRTALDDARRQGLAVIPLCPYMVIFIRRHPEYIDLVPIEERALLDGEDNSV